VKKTYVEFVCEELNKEQIGAPIYSNQIAAKVEYAFNLEPKAAAAATAVAFKRILAEKQCRISVPIKRASITAQ
jgi:hypothetical protein